MRDVFEDESPLGWVGRLADDWFLRDYMHKLLRKRADVIKAAAEGWRPGRISRREER
jgi:hypothetical protein